MSSCFSRPSLAVRGGLASLLFCVAAAPVALLSLALAASPALHAAEPGKTSIDVTSVRSNLVRSPGGGDAWLEFEVTLDVRPGEAGKRFVDRVRVVTWLGFDLGSSGASVGGAGAAITGGAGAGSERKFAFFRAQAEAVTIEAGRAIFRFYLPPEVVKRDSLREPKLYALEFSAAGEAVPLAKSHVATAIASQDALTSFKARAAAEAAANDGILLPQYLTPFFNAYERATPSFIRREGSR